MTIECGDLIRVNNVANYYNGRIFTVVAKEYNSRRDELNYFCLGPQMLYHKRFSETDIVKITSSPKFPIGTSVRNIRPSAQIQFISPGIIIGSNSVASLVRVWVPLYEEHRDKYMSNNNLRLLK